MDRIAQALNSTRTVALVGASDKPARDSFGVMQYMQTQGYKMIPINPSLKGKSINGEVVRGSLADIDQPFEMVEIFRNSEAAGHVVDEVLKLPSLPKFIWMQLGVVNEEAAHRAREAGIIVIMDKCPKIEIPRLSLTSSKL
jgi:predicted CoA-binding protein